MGHPNPPRVPDDRQVFAAVAVGCLLECSCEDYWSTVRPALSRILAVSGNLRHHYRQQVAAAEQARLDDRCGPPDTGKPPAPLEKFFRRC
jgi:hypothetical protein